MLVRLPVVYLPSVAYSEHEDLSAKDGEDDPVIADTQFPQPSELPLQYWIRVSSRGEILLDPIEYSPRLGFSEAGEVLLHTLLVGDVKGQGISSFHGWT